MEAEIEYTTEFLNKHNEYIKLIKVELTKSGRKTQILCEIPLIVEEKDFFNNQINVETHSWENNKCFKTQVIFHHINQYFK